MKKLIIMLFVVIVFPTLGFATTWCTWSGTQGENCQSDARGYLRMPGDNHPIGPPASNYVYHGFTVLEETPPALGPDQVRDTVVWEFVSHPVQGDKITKTWTVRDLTPQEILNRDASRIREDTFHLWKAIIQFTPATAEQVRTYLEANQPDLVEAWDARNSQ